MSASTPLLSLKGITKIFPGVRALENVQLDLWPGKVTALIGENGAGKSTLVKVMTGIYQPEEGEILYKAIPIHLPTPESAHKVGITAIHQETVLFDELSVSENIFVGQYLYKGLLKTLDWPAMHRRANEILTRLEVQIDPRATLKTLSIAQRHMVAIARALILNPDFIVADEPISALDVSIQAQIINLFSDLRDNRGVTFLFISHDLGVVEHLCDDVAVMYLGQLVESASRDALFNRPLHPYTRALLAAVPTLDPHSEPQALVQGEIPDPANPPAGCRFSSRCPLASERCRREPPALREVAPGHRVACHWVAS